MDIETRAWKASFNTSAGPRGRCWNQSMKGAGFITSRGAQQMLMYQKSMFDRYYCMKTFCSSKTLRKCSEKVFFPASMMAQKGTLAAKRWKHLFQDKDGCHFDVMKLCLLLCMILVMTSVFVTAPEGTYVKPQSYVLTTWIALLIHEFLPFKTWLLIVCDTAFYAIIGLKWVIKRQKTIQI